MGKNRIIMAALAFMFMLLGCQQTMNKSEKQEMNKEFELGKGINLSHWLSQVPEWMQRDSFITQQDIQQIADFGFNHVRIPIDEEVMWTEEGEPIEESFNYLKSCLDWSKDAGLKAIVDLHILRSHHFNAGNDEGEITLWTDSVAQQNFVKLWKDISAQINSYTNNFVAYELLNEPVADDPNDWNKLIAMAVTGIRVLEPERKLVIGANMWQTAANFPYLKVPEGDTNIILSIHTYDPLPVTHYKASWNEMKDYAGPVQYPGQIIAPEDVEKYTEKDSRTRKFIENVNGIWNQDKLEESLMPAITKADSLGLPLYCGEFGCLPTLERNMRLQYYRDITGVFQKHNIDFAAWDYKGDFGIVAYDRQQNKNLAADTTLINIILLKE